MATTVYLHIGAPKTGTTYIQDTLWAHRDVLRAAGVLVPGGRRFAAFHAAQAIREVPWLKDMPPGRRDVWLDMQQRIGDWPGTAVLSHEFLGGATAEQAARAVRALAPADVHVVFTARDYVALFPALWQEAVKMGTQMPLKRYTAKVLRGDRKGPWSLQTIDAVAILDRWGSAVGPGKVHVVTVPGPGSEPGLLWRRFAGVCGIDPDRFPPPAQPSNTSLGVAETELVRRVAGRLPEGLAPKRVRHKWVRDYFAQDVLAGRPGPRPTLDPVSAARVRELGEQAVSDLARRGYHVVGDLDELVATPIPTSASPAPTDADLLDVAVAAIGELIDRQRVLRADRDALVRDAAQRPGQVSGSSTAAGAS